MVKATCNAFDMASNAPVGTSVLADSGAFPHRLYALKVELACYSHRV